MSKRRVYTLKRVSRVFLEGFRLASAPGGFDAVQLTQSFINTSRAEWILRRKRRCHRLSRFHPSLPTGHVGWVCTPARPKKRCCRSKANEFLCKDAAPRPDTCVRIANRSRAHSSPHWAMLWKVERNDQPLGRLADRMRTGTFSMG